MLEVRRLRLLYELSQRGTLAATARALDFTPSAVSQQLTALEREAGVVLLERDGRGVTLTPAAEALVARTRRIIDELEAAQADLQEAAGQITGVVRVAAFPTAVAALVAPGARAVIASHPDIDVRVHEADPAEGLALLRAGSADLVVAYQYDLLNPVGDGGVVTTPLIEDPVLIAVPSGHPLAGNRSLALGALRDENWVAGLSGTPFGQLVNRACRRAGFEPRVVHRAREFAVQTSLVRAGLGVALLPSLGDGSKVDGVTFLASDRPAPLRHVFAMLRRGAERRPAIRTVLHALVDVATRTASNRSVAP